MLKITEDADLLHGNIHAQEHGADLNQSDLTVQLKVTSAALPEKKAEIERAGNDYFGFRVKHKVSEEVVLPDAMETLFALGFIIFAEGAINSLPLMTAHMTAGYVSALLLSLLISLCNVSFSALMGYFSRWIGFGAKTDELEAYRWHRAGGYAAVTAYIIVIGYFLLIVGMMLAQAATDITFTFEMVKQVFITPTSVFFGIVAIAMSLQAFLKGRNGCDTAYPVLGQKYRIMLHKQEELLALWADDAEDVTVQLDERLSDYQDDAIAQQKDISRHKQLESHYVQATNHLTQTVEQERNTLLTAINTACQDYEAATGKPYVLSGDKRAALTDFDHILADIRAPTPLGEVQDLRQSVRTLHEAKHRILSHYHQLLDGIFTPPQETQS